MRLQDGARTPRAPNTEPGHLEDVIQIHSPLQTSPV